MPGGLRGFQGVQSYSRGSCEVLKEYTDVSGTFYGASGGLQFKGA